MNHYKTKKPVAFRYMDKEPFLPERVELPVLPKKWSPVISIIEVKRRTENVLAVEAEIVHGFWVAHEQLINNKNPRWNFERFCEEAGFDMGTIYEFFEKYHLIVTKNT
jgi:hypothetical protein